MVFGPYARLAFGGFMVFVPSFGMLDSYRTTFTKKTGREACGNVIPWIGSCYCGRLVCFWSRFRMASQTRIFGDSNCSSLPHRQVNSYRITFTKKTDRDDSVRIPSYNSKQVKR